MNKLNNKLKKLTIAKKKKIKIKEEKRLINIKNFIKSSIECIKFGWVFPGNILEQELEIFNIFEEDLTVKITVDCLNKEFDKLDEYVFSTRKTTNLDYNDVLFMNIPKNSSLKIKIALKTPNYKFPMLLKGKVNICLKNSSQIIVPIYSLIEIPKIECKFLFIMIYYYFII